VGGYNFWMGGKKKNMNVMKWRSHTIEKPRGVKNSWQETVLATGEGVL